MIYERLMRPMLMKMEAERAHDLAVKIITSPFSYPFFALNQAIHGRTRPALATKLCGISLEHPVGLAAGFDKNARMYARLDQLGFSFVEIGTVTPKPQPGNEKPRLFRLVRDRALINRMGFNNEGAEAAAHRLRVKRPKLTLGVNIGKNKATALDQVHADYAFSFERLKEHAAYFVVNVSSPNTPGLRTLQEKEPLRNLLRHLTALNQGSRTPLLLKIAPDLNDHQLADIVEVVDETGIDGVIATNTTISRNELKTESLQLQEIGAGGLSGPPLRARSTAIIRFLREQLPARVDIVGVGGVASGSDVLEKINAGARCVQIYTSLIYRGPNTVFKILGELQELLGVYGFENIEQAIGANVKMAPLAKS